MTGFNNESSREVIASIYEANFDSEPSNMDSDMVELQLV